MCSSAIRHDARQLPVYHFAVLAYTPFGDIALSARAELHGHFSARDADVWLRSLLSPFYAHYDTQLLNTCSNNEQSSPSEASRRAGGLAPHTGLSNAPYHSHNGSF